MKITSASDNIWVTGEVDPEYQMRPSHEWTDDEWSDFLGRERHPEEDHSVERSISPSMWHMYRVTGPEHRNLTNVGWVSDQFGPPYRFFDSDGNQKYELWPPSMYAPSERWLLSRANGGASRHRTADLVLRRIQKEEEGQ